MSGLISKLPTAEKLFFFVVLLLAGVTFLEARFAAPELSDIRSTAVSNADAGGMLATQVETALKSKGEVAPTDNDPNGLRRALESAHRPIEKRPGRAISNTGDNYQPMDPLSLRAFRVFEVPGYAPAVGPGPEMGLRSRPIAKNRNRVTLGQQGPTSAPSLEDE